MIKYLRVVYFHIYNSYYKDGNYSNDIPEITAFGLVGTGFGFSIGVLCGAISQTFINPRIATNALVVGFIIAFGLAFFLFQIRKKHDAIYNEIKGSRMDTPSIKILSWIVIFLQFASVIVYSYTFSK